MQCLISYTYIIYALNGQIWWKNTYVIPGNIEMNFLCKCLWCWPQKRKWHFFVFICIFKKPFFRGNIELIESSQQFSSTSWNPLNSIGLDSINTNSQEHTDWHTSLRKASNWASRSSWEAFSLGFRLLVMVKGKPNTCSSRDQRTFHELEIHCHVVKTVSHDGTTTILRNGTNWGWQQRSPTRGWWCVWQLTLVQTSTERQKCQELTGRHAKLRRIFDNCMEFFITFAKSTNSLHLYPPEKHASEFFCRISFSKSLLSRPN